MNVLPLMQLITAGLNGPAQMKTLFEQQHGLPLGAFEGFFLANEDLNLTGQQTADGGGTLGSDDLGLSNRLPVEANGQILFAVVLCLGQRALRKTARIVRVARILRAVKWKYFDRRFPEKGTPVHLRSPRRVLTGQTCNGTSPM